LIAAYLENSCAPEGGNWNVPALGPDQSYVGPYTENANYCSCSSVVYSLVSACAACQNDLWIAWSAWKNNCTADITSLGSWPLDIPAGTAVPDWAYQNVSLHDTFNITIPHIDKAPASTYVGVPTASINPHASAASAASAASTSQGAAPSAIIPPPQVSQSSDNSGGSKTPVGAIVGGVIGGIAVLFLLGILAFLLLRQKRQKANSEMPLVDQVSNGPGMTETDSSLPAGFGVGYPSPQRLYDPSDPSTFPVMGRGDTPASFGVLSDQTALSHSAPTSTSYPTSNPTNSTYPTSSGRYTGAAEV